ncbi:MAG: phosphopentomutase [Escherichia coli]|nr:phosphopentomutase [Escherichia coli]
MKRAFIMVLDSFGIGATEDAERFGDVGADTLGHIAEACAKGEADNGRKGPLNLPNLTRLGLAKAHEGSTGFIPAGMDGNAEVIGAYAWAHEMSSGKDTPSGHWEIAGVPVLFEWGYFSDHENSFPQELLDKLVERANLPGYLGNCHSSGTVILDQLGEEHMKTGKPIFYTSADSVFQIACHEETFGLDKLYELCEIAREELTNGGYNIGRVIARPFIGDKAGNFQRTGNRHDLAVEPPAPTVLQKLVERANLPGYLGNCHSSGTVILDQLGEEHMKTGKPIFYTSADSVFQIACHEETFGLDKLYELCEIAREELTNGGYNIGRVIARPFIGDKAGNFQRTGNRHDLAVEPPAPTVLQKLVDEKHGQVVSVGKIADIYANCGITKKVKATGLDALFDATIKEMKEAGDNTIVFTNFVDFDSSWGHRRDVAGYAAGLELFDRRLPELMSLLRDDDILILTADHGCDPTWTGTDHTREHIPVLVYGPKVKPGSLGHRETFADIGQTLAKYFGTSDMEYGKAMF